MEYEFSLKFSIFPANINLQKMWWSLIDFPQKWIIFTPPPASENSKILQPWTTCIFIPSTRFLRSWLMVWNGYDGHIYITTALRLPVWQPPRRLLKAKHPKEKLLYPTLISDLGDRLGETHLHLYWRDLPYGPGPISSFKKVELELYHT